MLPAGKQRETDSFEYNNDMQDDTSSLDMDYVNALSELRNNV